MGLCLARGVKTGMVASLAEGYLLEGLRFKQNGERVGMRITEIFLESFGASRRVFINGLGPGLTAIVGPNEAGKTTILEFVRSVFFGFKRRSGKTNTYEAPDGLPRRGWIGVESAAAGRIRVSRNERTGAREGLLSVSDENGLILDPMSVPLFQAGLKRSVYESLFAFDLEQMRRLDQDALRGRIMAAALGSTRVNPLEVRNHLEERLKALTRRSAKDPESLWTLQARIKELEKKLKLLEQRPQHYSGLKEELEAAEARAALLASEISEKEARQRQLANILRFRQAWQRLAALDAEMGLLEHAASFPADGISRLEQCLERRLEAVREFDELEKSVGCLRARLATLNPSEPFLRNADEIQSLLREARRLVDRPGDMDNLRAALEREAANLNEEIAGLGHGWNLDRVREFDPSAILEQEIRAFLHHWHESEAGIRNLEPRLADSSERCNRLRERIRRNGDELQRMAAMCSDHLSPDERENLRRWKELKDKVAEMNEGMAEKTRALQRRAAERADASERMSSLQAEPIVLIPAWIFLAVVALLGSTAVGMAVAASRSNGPNFYLFAAMGGLLAAVLPLMVRWKTQAERTHRSRVARQRDAEKSRYFVITEDLVGIETERRTLQQRIRELERRTREIATEVLGRPNADWEDVAEAERASTSAEEPTRMSRMLEDSIKFDQSDLAAEEMRHREILRQRLSAGEQMEKVQRSWDSFLSEKGIQPGVGPETVLELVFRLRDLRKRLPRMIDEENSFREMQREWQQFAERVSDAGNELDDRISAGLSPFDRVERWSRMEQEARETLSERKLTMERFKEHEQRLNAVKRRIEELDDGILSLMEAAGTDDEESFRQLGQMHERYRLVERDRRVAVLSLAEGLGIADEHAMREHVQNQNWQANSDDEAALQADLEDMRREVEELARREGMLRGEIQTLEAEDETDLLLMQKEELVACLKERADEFILTDLASTILDKTIEIYESEKQPKLLERSSHLFREITGHRYKRVLFPLDGQGIKVEREDGVRIDEDLLSRGTLEQLYLSLRLAHLDVYHRDYVTIPLLMDDVLVNFDLERASRTAATLATFSQESGIQVLFFTCHPHVTSLFPRDTARIDLKPNSADAKLITSQPTGLFAN